MATSFATLLSKFSLGKREHLARESRPRSDVDSLDPNKAWQLRRRQQKHEVLARVDPDTPVSETNLRVVCISDTHTRLEKHGCLKIPDGDILVHAGDFTMYGLPDEVKLVNTYLGTLPHKHKVVIAGNHDMTFDLDFIARRRRTSMWSITDENYETRLKALGARTVHDLLTNVTYLQDGMVDICGVNIYGAPWQPARGNWGFNLRRGQACLDKWEEIPVDTDILVTHGPPLGHGDSPDGNMFERLFSDRLEADHCGCVDLLNTVQRRVKPKFHVFGHIHEGYGISTDGTTTFINASTCDVNYMPSNRPIVVDIALPELHTKDEPLTRILQNKESRKKTGNKHSHHAEHVREGSIPEEDIQWNLSKPDTLSGP